MADIPPVMIICKRRCQFCTRFMFPHILRLVTIIIPSATAFWSLAETSSLSPSIDSVSSSSTVSLTKSEDISLPSSFGSTTASTFMESILLVGVPGKALICLNEWPFSFSGSVCPIWQYCNYNIGSFRKTAKFGISLLLPLHIMQASRITNNECSTSKPFVIVPLLLFSWLVQMTFGQIMLTGQSLLNSMILGHQ